MKYTIGSVEFIVDYIYGPAAKDTRGCKYTSWETYFTLTAGVLCILCTLSRRCRLYFIDNFLRKHFCSNNNFKSSRVKSKTYCSIGKKLGRVPFNTLGPFKITFVVLRNRSNKNLWSKFWKSCPLVHEARTYIVAGWIRLGLVRDKVGLLWFPRAGNRWH